LPAQAAGFFIATRPIFLLFVPAPLPPWPFLRLQKDGSVLIDVHVMPNAARTEACGLHDGALRLRLHAPPVDGKANAALQAWLADTLGIPKSRIELLRGAGNRRKTWRVDVSMAGRADWKALNPSD